MTATEKKVAYIFQEATGLWHYCHDAAGMLDARGTGYRTKALAIAAAREYQNAWDGTQYTHYRTGGKPARKIR